MFELNVHRTVSYAAVIVFKKDLVIAASHNPVQFIHVSVDVNIPRETIMSNPIY